MIKPTPISSYYFKMRKKYNISLLAYKKALREVNNDITRLDEYIKNNLEEIKKHSRMSSV